MVSMFVIMDNTTGEIRWLYVTEEWCTFWSDDVYDREPFGWDNDDTDKFLVASCESDKLDDYAGPEKELFKEGLEIFFKAVGWTD